MRTSDIKSILKKNPDTLFHFEYKRPKDYYGHSLISLQLVVNVTIHRNGYFLVTERGRQSVEPAWREHEPYRVTARNIIKVYETNQDNNA